MKTCLFVLAGFVSAAHHVGNEGRKLATKWVDSTQSEASSQQDSNPVTEGEDQVDRSSPPDPPVLDAAAGDIFGAWQGDYLLLLITTTTETRVETRFLFIEVPSSYRFTEKNFDAEGPLKTAIDDIVKTHAPRRLVRADYVKSFVDALKNLIDNCGAAVVCHCDPAEPEKLTRLTLVGEFRAALPGATRDASSIGTNGLKAELFWSGMHTGETDLAKLMNEVIKEGPDKARTTYPEFFASGPDVEVVESAPGGGVDVVNTQTIGSVETTGPGQDIPRLLFDVQTLSNTMGQYSHAELFSAAFILFIFVALVYRRLRGRAQVHQEIFVDMEAQEV